MLAELTGSPSFEAVLTSPFYARFRHTFRVQRKGVEVRGGKDYLVEAGEPLVYEGCVCIPMGDHEVSMNPEGHRARAEFRVISRASQSFAKEDYPVDEAGARYEVIWAQDWGAYRETHLRRV